MPEDAASLPGPKVVVDFHTGTVSAVSASGNTVHSSPLPTETKSAPDAVTDAVLRLRGK